MHGRRHGIFTFVELGLEPTTLHTLGKHSTSELYAQPLKHDIFEGLAS